MMLLMLSTIELAKNEFKSELFIYIEYLNIFQKQT